MVQACPPKLVNRIHAGGGGFIEIVELLPVRMGVVSKVDNKDADDKGSKKNKRPI